MIAAGLFGGYGRPLLFIAAIPLALGFVPLARRVGHLRTHQIVPGLALATMAATLCDGIALTWLRGLYGTDPAEVLAGAAWLFWGVGLGLLWAFLLERRPA